MAEKHGTEVWNRDEIESPCVNICVVQPKTRLCTGCGRSIDEIRDWSRFTPEVRSEIMSELPQRMVDMKPSRRGGRAARLKR